MRSRPILILPPRHSMISRCVFVLVGLAILATAAPSKAIDAAAKPLDANGQVTIEEVLAKRKTVAGQITALTPQQDAGSTDADPTDVSTAEDELEFELGAGGGGLLPQALSNRVAANASGSPAISLICMWGFLFGRNFGRSPSPRRGPSRA